MLEGHHRWAVLKVTDDANGCIGITDIVEGQLLAVELLGCGDRILCRQGILVEVCILLRVFSVAHGLFEVVGQGQFFRLCLTNLSGEIVRDEGIVGCGVAEYFCG